MVDKTLILFWFKSDAEVGHYMYDPTLNVYHVIISEMVRSQKKQDIISPESLFSADSFQNILIVHPCNRPTGIRFLDKK